MFTVDEFVARLLQLRRKLYHFTDSRNIDSIRELGLFPTREINVRSIAAVTGGDAVSLSIDAQKGLDGHVSLSFCPSHPMSHVAQGEGRIQGLRILHVCPSVLLRDGALVADQVATANDATIGHPNEMLPKMDLEATYRRLDWRTGEGQSRRQAAEKWESLDTRCHSGKLDQRFVMAKRPIFVPLINGKGLVLEHYVDFEWHAGFAKSQKQKSIRALHETAFKEYGVQNPLEVSSKSENALGVALSSFNLSFETKRGRLLTVEAAFQGSKVFEYGGPYRDIFDMRPIDAKRDARLRESGALEKFLFFGVDWALEPKTAFYDWLYINALVKNRELALQVTDIDGFTDIEFNPEKSINCQARAAALYCALFHSEKLDFAFSSKENFISLYKGRVSDPHVPGEIRYLI